jgi:hypothetical protein
MILWLVLTFLCFVAAFLIAGGVGVINKAIKGFLDIHD